MSEFLKGLKANYTVSAGLCTLLGLVLLIWPGTTMRIVCTLFGSMLLIYGLLQIILYLVNRERTVILQGMMVFGIVLAVIGLWILMSPDVLIMAVPVIVGVLIVIHGVHNVVQALALKRDDYDRWWLALLFGVFTVVFGGILVYNPFEVVETVVRFIGVFLIYDGISDIWILSRVFKVKREKERIIDVDYVDVDD